MTDAKSVFSRTNRAFENARLSCLTRHEIGFPSVVQVMQASSRLFQMLDRADSIQTEILRRIWVLRSSILFTVLPFDDPALRLQHQVNELELASRGLPDAAELIEALRKSVMGIVSVGLNPKREWLLHMLGERIGNDDGQIGILCALSAGRPPGWPPESYGQLSALSGVMLIRSRRHLRSNVFGTVVLPCACRNAPPAILSDLLFSGVAARLEVLLYPDERFQVPKRLTLPSDGIFAGRLQKTKIEKEVVVVPGELTQSTVDTWMNEAFWQGLHGAARNKFARSRPGQLHAFL